MNFRAKQKFTLILLFKYLSLKEILKFYQILKNYFSNVTY